MSEARMSREERDRGLDARGAEAKVYYAKAMREAGEILKAGRSGYYSTQRRIGFTTRPEGK